MKALVIGGGFSGTAAAVGLAAAGAEVLLVHAGAGASQLYSGAMDRVAWTGDVDDAALPHDIVELAEKLGVRVTSQGAWVGTAFGVVRAARAVDTAVLDLSALSGKTIGVIDPGRPGWNADLLARGFEASQWAEQTGTRFRAVRVRVTEAYDLAWVSDVDVAAGMHESQRFDALVRELRELPQELSGLLFGPWLGVETGLAERLARAVARPVGETLSEPGGPAGLRFVRNRERLLEQHNVRTQSAHIRSVASGAGGWFAQTVNGEAPLGPFERVVLAVGGVAGGGVRFRSGEPTVGGRSFALSLEAPVSLRLSGREVSLHSGADGVDLQSLGMTALSQVGVAVDERLGIPHQEGLHACGDVLYQRPRAALEAIASGLTAAREALRA